MENTSDKDDISKIAETIIKKISEPNSIDGVEFKISCSVGIATYPENGTNMDALLLYADKGMYKAKQKEPGTYHFLNTTSNLNVYKNLIKNVNL